MADWENEDFEPGLPAAAVPAASSVLKDKWEGEDEDDDVKDNWDDEEEEAKPQSEQTVSQREKKKPLKERIAEKKAKQLAEAEERKRLAEEAERSKSAEELAAERERQRLREEEDQIMLAKELMGVTVEPKAGIEAMQPSTPEEFSKFAAALKEKISEFENSPFYVTFLEDLFRDLSASQSSENIKKLGATLTTLSNEKLKIEKGNVKKKKKKGPSLAQGRDNDFDEDEYGYNDMDDFM